MPSFLKILKFVFISLFILILTAVIGFVAFIKTFDINRYKPQIVAMVKKSTGRDMDFEKMQLSISLKDGIRVNVKNIKLSDDPAFKSNDFLVLDDIYVGIDILSYWARKDVVITKLQIDSAKIVIIRNFDGQLNITQQMKAKSDAPGQPNPAASDPSPTPPSSQKESRPPTVSPENIFIHSLQLENAQIVYIDRSLDPVLEFSIKKLNCTLERFSLNNEPFAFVLDGALGIDQTNFNLQGQAQLNLKARALKLRDVNFTTDLNKLPFEEIRHIAKGFTATPLPEALEGQLSVLTKELTADAQGVTSVLLDLKLTNGKIVWPEIISGFPLAISQTDLQLKDFSLSGQPFHVSFQTAYLSEKSNIAFDSLVKLDLTRQHVELSNTTASVDLSALPLSELKTKITFLKDIPLPEVLRGQVQTSIRNLTASPGGLEDFVLDLNYSNGEVKFANAASGVSIDASSIDLKLRNFSLNKPFQFALKAAYLWPQPNIHLNGTAFVDVRNKSVQFKKTEIALDLDALAIDQLKASLAALKDVRFPGSWGGKIDATLKEAAVSKEGLTALVMDADIHNGKFSFKDAAPGISLAVDKIDLNVKDFSLKGEPFKVALHAAYLSDQQNIIFDGTARVDLKSQNIQLNDASFTTNLEEFSLAGLKNSMAVFKDKPLPDHLGGTLQTKIKTLSAGPKGIISLLLDINWQDGAVNFKDIAPGISLDAAQINFQVKDLSSPGKAFLFDLSAACLSPRPNITAAGTATFDLAAQNIQIQNSKMITDLALISLSDLKTSVPSLKDVPLPDSLKGEVVLTIDQMQVSPKGPGGLTVRGSLTNGALTHPALAVPVDKAQADFQMTESKFTVDSLTMALGTSAVTMQGVIDDYLGQQNFNASVKSEGLNLAEIVNQKDIPVKFHGLLVADMNVQGQGLTLEALQKSLNGNGSFEIKEGLIKDLNILKAVLNKLEMFPKLRGIEQALPERYQDTLTRPDTVLSSAVLKADIVNGTITINPASLAAEGFMFSGQGQADLSQKYNFAGSFFIMEDLTESLVQAEENLQFLLDENKRIQFPITISGEGANVTFMPDVSYITRRAAINYGRGELKKVLDNVFDKGESNQADESGDGDSPPTREQRPEQKILENILDSIFK